MATVDSLEIKISASAETAIGSLDKLIGKLGALENKLSGVQKAFKLDTSSFVQQANAATEALTKIANTAEETVKKISKIKADTFDTQGFKRITEAFSGMKNMPDISGSVNRMVSSMARLANAGDKISIVNRELPSLTEFLRKVMENFSRMPDISESTNIFVKSITQLSNAGNKAGQTAAQLKALAQAVTEFFQTMVKAPQVSDATIRMMESLSRLASTGNRTSTSFRGMQAAISGSRHGSVALASALKGAGSVLAGMLGTIKNVSTHTVKSTLNTKRLADAMNGIRTSVKNAANSMKSFVQQLNTVTGGMKRFLTQIASAAGVQLNVVGAVKGFFNSVESSMNMIETYNYFQAAFNQVSENAVSGWKSSGYASAESYAKSFSERAKELTAKMTGFNVSESGVLTETRQASLGIDPNLLMNYQATFAQMSSSMGVASETALKLSEALTKIGADLASVRNMDFKKTWNDMASGLVGMSRTWDKYGVNIRNVNMQQKLNELGIKANIDALNQNDKALLRTIILLDSTKYSFGDLSKTLNAPANQLRLLQSNLANLSRTIGGLFLPTIAKILPYINGFVIALQRMFTWIGKLLNIKPEEVSSGIGNSAIDMGNLADETEDAAKNTKELKKALLGFDQLNILGSDDSEDIANSLENTLKLQEALDKALEEYNKKWNEAFKNLDNKAEEVANNIEKTFESIKLKIETGDIEGVGKEISTKLTNAINSIDWDEIYNKAGNFGTGLAAFLNGLITPELFSSLGSTIAGAINTVISTLGSFADPKNGFNFSNLGKSLGAGANKALEDIKWEEVLTAAKNWGKGIAKFLNSSIKETDFELIGKTVAKFIKVAVEGWYKFVKNFKFSKLGEKIGQSINAFFDEMAETDKKGQNGWQKLGKTLTKTAVGIEDAIIAALNKINFAEIAQAIADLLGSVNVKKITWKLGKIVNSLVNAFYTLVSNKEIWSQLALKISDGINGFLKGLNEVDKKTKLTGWQALGKSIESSITGITDSLITALDGVDFGTVAQGIADSISSADWKKITWKLGELANSLATSLYELVSKKETFVAIGEAIGKGISGLFASLETKNKKTGLTLGETLGKTFTNAMTNLASGINKFLSTSDFETIGRSIVRFMTDLVSNIKFGEIIASGMENIEPLIDAILDIIKGAFKGAWDAIKKNPAILFKPIGMTGGLLGKGISAGADLLFGNKEKETTGNSKSSGGRSLDEIKKFTEQLSADISNTWVAPELPVKAKSTTDKETITSWKTKIENNWKSPALSVSNKLDTTLEDVAKWEEKVKRDWIDPKLPVNNAFKSTKEDTNQWSKKLEELWKDPKLQVGNALKTNKENTDKWAAKVEGYWKDSAPTLKVNNSLATKKIDVSEWWSKIKEWFGERTLSVKVVFDTITNKIKGAVESVGNFLTGSSGKNAAGYSLYSSDMPQYEMADLGWYAKGGVFNNASIIGVGEAGREAVLPLQNKQTMSMIADSIMKNYSGAGTQGFLEDIKEEIKEAVIQGMMEVFMATKDSQQTVNVTCDARLNVDSETLARSVIKGQQKLDRRYHPSPRYGY